LQKLGENVNSASYYEVLLKPKHPGQWQEEHCFIMIMPDPHTARATHEIIQELRVQWELLEHPLYSPDLAPSDFHLFGPLRNQLDGKRFAEDEEVETRKWLRQQKTSTLWVSTPW
jgi:hypothetical protein